MICANHERSFASLVMCCQGSDVKHFLNYIFREALFLQAHSCILIHHILRARTCNHTLDFNTNHVPGRLPGGDCLSNQTIDFLSRTARDRRLSLQGKGSTNMYFRSERFLLLNDSFCNILGEKLNVRPCVSDNFFHHLVQRIAETRHMHPGLGSAKISVKVKLRIEPLLMAFFISDENSLCNTNNPCPSESDMYAWFTILNVSI